jgi:hypothetical protein
VSGWQQALIVGAGALLLLGIAWAIIGDARARAPKDRTGNQESARAGREAEHHRRKERSRAAGRRARAARRRNR